MNRLLFDAGVADELFLTIGAIAVGGRNRPGIIGGRDLIPRDAMPRFELLHAIPNPDTDEVYLRYRARRHS
jgi:riboflavin biosynthesis pyrimidine reductase